MAKRPNGKHPETPAQPTPRWQNRIVGYGNEAPDQLLANPKNWRIHPQTQQDPLLGVLDEVGWVDEVTVNRRTGFVVDGHLRVALALRYDEPLIPVKYVDLSEAEEDLVLATLDSITSLAGVDAEKLHTLLGGVQTTNPSITAMLAKLADDHAEGDGATSDASLLALTQVTIAEPTYTVKTEDVWHIGRHLLICADVIGDWRLWTKYLIDDDDLFVPYPGPFVPLSLKAVS